MKVRYIGEEAQIGSRATLAFGRTWHIGEWVDVYEGLGDAYWSQFGAKISKNLFFEVEGAPDVSTLSAVDADVGEVVAGQMESDPKPARKPRKPKQ